MQSTDVVYLEHPGGDLLATIYQPQGDGPFPGLLDVHGGRWFLNDRYHDQHMNSALAASGIVVVATDFRLAPERPYPVQIFDANYAVRWMMAQAAQLNIDAPSMGALGCSSGAHTVALNGLRPHAHFSTAACTASCLSVPVNLQRAKGIVTGKSSQKRKPGLSHGPLTEFRYCQWRALSIDMHGPGVAIVPKEASHWAYEKNLEIAAGSYPWSGSRPCTSPRVGIVRLPTVGSYCRSTGQC